MVDMTLKEAADIVREELMTGRLPSFSALAIARLADHADPKPRYCCGLEQDDEAHYVYCEVAGEHTMVARFYSGNGAYADPAAAAEYAAWKNGGAE